MPNAKVLEEKKALVASLVDKIKNSPAGVLVDYKGINVTCAMPVLTTLSSRIPCCALLRMSSG